MQVVRGGRNLVMMGGIIPTVDTTIIHTMFPMIGVVTGARDADIEKRTIYQPDTHQSGALL